MTALRFVDNLRMYFSPDAHTHTHTYDNEVFKAIKEDEAMQTTIRQSDRLRALLRPRAFAVAFSRMGSTCNNEVSIGEFEAFVDDAVSIAAVSDEGADHVFQQLDKDGSGLIGKFELLQTIREDDDVRDMLRHFDHMRALLRPRSFSRAFSEMDPSGEGLVSIGQFRDFMMDAASSVASADERVQRLYEADRVFGLLDKEGTGGIGKSELVHAINSDEAVRDMLRQSKSLKELLRPRTFALAFKSIDTNANGVTTLSEFRSFVTGFAPARGGGARAAGVVRPYDEVDRIFHELDRDNSGSIEKRELMKAVRGDERIRELLRKNESLSAMLRPSAFAAAFEQIDTSGDGLVSLEEFRAVAASAVVGSFAADEAADRVFHKIDKDNNGSIEKGELMQAIRSDEDVRELLWASEHLKGLLKPRAFAQAFAGIDVNGDGLLSKAEFRSVAASSFEAVDNGHGNGNGNGNGTNGPASPSSPASPAAAATPKTTLSALAPSLTSLVRRKRRGSQMAKLRTQLQKRGLDFEGSKTELVTRLHEAEKEGIRRAVEHWEMRAREALFEQWRDRVDVHIRRRYKLSLVFQHSVALKCHNSELQRANVVRGCRRVDGIVKRICWDRWRARLEDERARVKMALDYAAGIIFRLKGICFALWRAHGAEKSHNRGMRHAASEFRAVALQEQIFRRWKRYARRREPKRFGQFGGGEGDGEGKGDVKGGGRDADGSGGGRGKCDADGRPPPPPPAKKPQAAMLAVPVVHPPRPAARPPRPMPRPMGVQASARPIAQPQPQQLPQQPAGQHVGAPMRAMVMQPRGPRGGARGPRGPRGGQHQKIQQQQQQQQQPQRYLSRMPRGGPGAVGVVGTLGVVAVQPAIVPVVVPPRPPRGMGVDERGLSKPLGVAELSIPKELAARLEAEEKRRVAAEEEDEE